MMFTTYDLGDDLWNLTAGRRLGGGGRGHTRSVECHQALDEGRDTAALRERPF